MKLIIDIPEEEYEEIINSEDCGLHTLTRAIANGIVLPKGHERITDMDEAIALIEWACDKRTILEADKKENW